MLSGFPLTPSNCERLATVFASVPRVDLAIECATEGQSGAVLVDDPQAPSVFLLRSGPFAYLAGDSRCPAASLLLGALPPGTLLMPSGEGWLEAAQVFFASRLVETERYRFSASSLRLDYLRSLFHARQLPGSVSPIDLDFAHSVWGTDHFVDLSAYGSPEDFLERGVGFTVSKGEQVIGAAFAALTCKRGIEVSVYVMERYRQLGAGTALSAHLLAWCLEHGLEPHWDAANRESYRLASKLGYTYQGSYLAYYLSE